MLASTMNVYTFPFIVVPREVTPVLSLETFEKLVLVKCVLAVNKTQKPCLLIIIVDVTASVGPENRKQPCPHGKKSIYKYKCKYYYPKCYHPERGN